MKMCYLKLRKNRKRRLERKLKKKGRNLQGMKRVKDKRNPERREKNHSTPKQAIQHQKFYFSATEVSDEELVNEDDGECHRCNIRFKDDSSKWCVVIRVIIGTVLNVLD